jgi:broad specificity phosphatase PhoE
VLRCLVLHYSGLSIKDFRSIRIDNGSVLELSLAGDGRKTVICPA